ncbi:MAG: hypothetical protein FJZ01_10860 [Candidatus Sericytochromatia bacterium]|nr:hypothetical protein [Candidatus Tanganyikabacteria bacterium]
MSVAGASRGVAHRGPLLQPVNRALAAGAGVLPADRLELTAGRQPARLPEPPVAPGRTAAPPQPAPASPEGSPAAGPASLGEAAAQGAAQGARIGGLVGNVFIAGTLIRAGLKGVARIPAGSVMGRIVPWVGAAFSAFGLLNSGAALVRDLREPQLRARPIAEHALDVAGNLAIGAGTVALISGAFAAPWLVTIGAGFLLTAAAGFLHRDDA